MGIDIAFIVITFLLMWLAWWVAVDTRLGYAMPRTTGRIALCATILFIASIAALFE